MDDIVQQFEHALLSCQTTEDVEAIRLRYLGKKGIVSDLLRRFKEVPPEEKKSYGEKINRVKAYIENKIEQMAAELSQKEMAQQMQKEAIDVTLPGRPRGVSFR